MILQPLYTLLPDSVIAIANEAANHAIYVTEPPRGKRDVYDVASLIASCVERIVQAESECPTADEYRAALKAESKADTAHNAVKHSVDTRIRQCFPVGMQGSWRTCVWCNLSACRQSVRPAYQHSRSHCSRLR